MLNFLRNLRRNKVNSKYLKYALGEILLVMIGILLALQVNNWNEGLKLAKERNAFRSSLEKELQADRIYLTDKIEGLKSESDELLLFKEKVNSVDADLTQLKLLVQEELIPFITDFRGFNNNTYQSYSSSGRLNLLNNELQQELYLLNTMQIQTLASYEKLTDLYFVQISSFGQKYPLDIEISLIKRGKLYDEIWAKARLEELGAALNTWGTSKRNYYRIMISNLQEALDQTNHILDNYFPQ